MDYYNETNYISNSELSNVKKRLFDIRQSEKQDKVMKNAFFEGGLFDESVTLTVQKGYTAVYRTFEGKEVSADVYKRTKKMIDVLKSDKFIWSIIEKSSHQSEFYNTEFQYEYKGIAGKCWFKGRLDFLYKNILASDLKSTVCESQKSFENAIFHFGYDRQGACYMDLAKVDLYYIFAVSKKNLKLFKYAIKRDSDIYRRAKAERDSLIFTKLFES